MKEKDARTIENMGLEQLTVLEDLLYLEEYEGKDVIEVRAKVQEEIGKKTNRYEGHTIEELENSLLRAQRLEEEGISMTETIIKVEKALKEKVDSGIIYQRKQYPSRPEKEDAV